MAENFRPKKSLGQHFLTDPIYCRRIATLAEISKKSSIIEIGPGTGQLTAELLDRGARVVAVEIDRDMIRYLEERFSQYLQSGQLTLIEGDILQANLSNVAKLFAETEAAATLPRPEVLGNLPYNVATHTLQRMTQTPIRFQKYTFMVQKEVANRILARPRTKDYGYLTLLLSLHFLTGPGFDVPPGAFRPPPRVLSHVFQMFPRRDPLLDARLEKKFVKLIQAAFRHRRKTLHSNLKSLVDGPLLEEALQETGIARKARAEEVELERFISLARVLSFRL